jgi:hypothetical protein
MGMEHTTTDIVDAFTDASISRYRTRAREEATHILDAIFSGQFETEEYAIGMELEAYAVDDSNRLISVPDAVFETENCSPELGIHNVEMHTHPDVLRADGLRRQKSQLETVCRTVGESLSAHQATVVSDALWTIPPREGTQRYLSAGSEQDGMFIAKNGRKVPRYLALDYAIREYNNGTIEIGLPQLSSAPSMIVESLATSIQPHLQIPNPTDLPAYINAGIRTMGPVLALCSNSPFLPADLYAGVSDTDAAEIMTEASHELRIPIFEESVDTGSRKCRVPDDVDTVQELITDIVEDEIIISPPTLDQENRSHSLCDYPAFSAKRATYWRWIRPVICGRKPRGEQRDSTTSTSAGYPSTRIEYRPLPTQPTVRDTIGLQALVSGLLIGLVEEDHPLSTLSWDVAVENFYTAVDDGPSADLEWITTEGNLTSDQSRMYADLFTVARRGLSRVGVAEATIQWALRPIEMRRNASYQTPSAWKHAQVKRKFDDGHTLETAVSAMQDAYIRQMNQTDSFVEWDPAPTV